MAKARTDAELWKALEELGGDALDPNLPAAITDEAIRAAGGDPDALTKQGAAIAVKLQDEQRLAWQKTARQRAESFARKAARGAVLESLPRSEVLGRLDALRNDPRLGAPIVVAFRKRKPEESTDDELRSLLEDVEALRALEADDDDDAK